MHVCVRGILLYLITACTYVLDARRIMLIARTRVRERRSGDLRARVVTYRVIYIAAYNYIGRYVRIVRTLQVVRMIDALHAALHACVTVRTNAVAYMYIHACDAQQSCVYISIMQSACVRPAVITNALRHIFYAVPSHHCCSCDSVRSRM